MFKIEQNQNAYYIYDEKLIEFTPACFEESYWRDTNAIIGSAKGRGTTWFVQLDKVQGALRHYRRGGLFGKLISDHYIFTGLEKTRSIAEFKLLKTLSQAGVNVPKPIAARVVKRNFCYQADLLSEKIPDAQDLVTILQQRALTESEYCTIAKQIKKMHQAQVNHTDLNIHNILLDKQGKVWLIDFDKCYRQRGEVWKEMNLNRLLRSFIKEKKKRAIQWNKADWQHIKSVYSV